jgi:hypothetical protein
LYIGIINHFLQILYLTEEFADETDKTTTETVLQPNVTDNLGCGASKPKITNENIYPPMKKHKTLVGCVKEIIQKDTTNEMVLNNIALELNKLRKLKLRKMVLQVKYP